MLSCCVSERSELASLAKTVKAAGGAAVVGVPDSRPDGASVSPAGRTPAVTDQVNAPAPVAVSCSEYGTPTMPVASGDTVVTVTFGLTVRLNGRCAW